MRRLLLAFLFACIPYYGFSQSTSSEWKVRYDSLHRALKVVNADTSRIQIWIALANYHKFSRADSGIYYSTQAISLSRSIGDQSKEIDALFFLGLSYNTLGDYAKSIRIDMEILRIEEQINNGNARGRTHNALGSNYYYLGDFETSFDFLTKAHTQFISDHNDNLTAISGALLARDLFAMNKQDSAFQFAYKAKKIAETTNTSWALTYTYGELGLMYSSLGYIDSAIFYLKKSFSNTAGSEYDKSKRGLEIAKTYMAGGQIDSSIFYAKQALQVAIENKIYPNIVDADLFLSTLYEKNDPSIALQYSKMAYAYSDSLSNMSRMSSFRDFKDYDEQQRQFELESTKKEYQSRIRTNTLLGGIFTLLVIAFFLYRNNRQKQKAKQKIESAYDQLKSTQTQLIQSEKMASLGELTAGIAHEIQNPLNFVNNFSEVNNELSTELTEEAEKGNLDEIKIIAKDIKENSEKITHHGKRAGEIVKGMLQHSRVGSGKKEPTDINALCDEYLRLAYHGLRAKDKSFNAKFETDFDKSLEKIDVVPQDIGRVVLNLITNAFYVVNEKANNQQPTTNNESYEPTVSVSTKKEEGKILISVKDNGNGIPEHIKEKIFQPFFTTKPTGQGTGLGLSLSYDIVKAHGGELEIGKNESEGALFIIKIPLHPIP